jgi:transposase InsO family protein
MVIFMKKEEVRREFFKLRMQGHSVSQCKRILKNALGIVFSERTLKRWSKRLNEGEWDLKDNSTRPHRMTKKITPELVRDVLSLRRLTGWGENKISLRFSLSHTSINSILNHEGLCKPSKNKGKRKKWVRWQRQHPNSLWQIDHTDEMDKGNCYTLSVIDDCSRYSLALVRLNRVTTDVVTHILDELIKKHGRPREILSDNGGAYGLNSKHSRFDRWCKLKGIKHIRTKVHSPQTSGKVERLFKTMDEEMAFCKNDLEVFRMRYNHSRPHSSLDDRVPAEVYFSFVGLF